MQLLLAAIIIGLFFGLVYWLGRDIQPRQGG
jgi:hypothetical protein